MFSFFHLQTSTWRAVPRNPFFIMSVSTLSMLHSTHNENIYWTHLVVKRYFNRYCRLKAPEIKIILHSQIKVIQKRWKSLKIIKAEKRNRKIFHLNRVQKPSSRWYYAWSSSWFEPRGKNRKIEYANWTLKPHARENISRKPCYVQVIWSSDDG